MKTVVLDGFTANPGDLSWDAWHEALGQVVIYDRTAPDQVIDRALDAEIVLTNKVIMDADVMDRLPRLRYIGVLATGYNVVDVEAARRRGIEVTNIPAYSTMSVAQMVMAHLLNITHHVAQHAAAVREGRWQTSRDFCFWDTPLIELDGLTIGIVGLGHTGMATARMAQAMGMKVLAYTSQEAAPLQALGIAKASSYEDLFRRSDVLSLHCPLTPETHHLVCAERLALMKPTAILINTGRGPLVDEAALADALHHNRLFAAGVDVLAEEPPRQGSPLITAPRCYITPHIAWASQSARRRLLDVALRNILAFRDGKPCNSVAGK